MGRHRSFPQKAVQCDRCLPVCPRMVDGQVRVASPVIHPDAVREASASERRRQRADHSRCRRFVSEYFPRADQERIRRRGHLPFHPVDLSRSETQHDLAIETRPPSVQWQLAQMQGALDPGQTTRRQHLGRSCLRPSANFSVVQRTRLPDGHRVSISIFDYLPRYVLTISKSRSAMPPRARLRPQHTHI